MALPQLLRVSISPPELELIASEHLIEVVPLIAMDKTAFISVERTPAFSSLVLITTPRVHTGHFVPRTSVAYRSGWL